ncbi:MAG: organomercurial lyase [Candidatus Limnocylindrales bacterium]
MDPHDLEIRNATYRRFVELGRAPLVSEIAATLGRTDADIASSWSRLHDAHAIVLDGGGEIAMANPFAATPTPFRVLADGRSWFANCGWDAFGVGAALHVDSTVETTCADCDEPIHIDVVGGRPVHAGDDESEPVWHVLVPAAEWWTDIGFT